MYEKLQQIAVKDGARTHHISQKVEVSPTVIKLVQLGLDALNGRLPDTISNVSDNLPDKILNTLSDKNNDISDISDKRIEAIVDRRLAELGILPDCQTEDNPTLHSLPDKVDAVPDSLPDNDAIISDKGALLPDSLPDTKNTPSDDSSNSESVAEDVQVPSSFSFGEFHDWLGLTRTTRNKVNGDSAIDFARSQGRGEWVMSKSYKFTKLTESN
ncbi:hypothetical protein [Chamaesiphon sp.]|uniref:hypothetical protein n=1 Tax=Chamaesiphon sp. TaxID=2814140 RepID=UPI0035936C43